MKPTSLAIPTAIEAFARFGCGQRVLAALATLALFGVPRAVAAVDDPPSSVVVQPPAAPNYELMSAMHVNVRETGAKGDGATDDTAAIQKALDGGERTVEIPAGVYRISAALQLDSGTKLEVDPHAVIQLANNAGTGPNVFLLKNRDFTGGNHDIVVHGGIWDGNNERNPRGAKPPCYTGVAINFAHVQRLVLSGLVIRNPETIAIRAWRLSDFLIEDIGFDFSMPRSSQDGVHLNGYCVRGVVRNLRTLSTYATNDDMVALNADDATGNLPVIRVMCQDVELGPIHDIRIEHLRADRGYTFVRLLSRIQPIENVIVSDVQGGCRGCAINLHNWQFPVGSGKIRNVLFRDFRVEKLADTLHSSRALESAPLIWVRLGVQGLRIENFQRVTTDGPAAPTLFVDNSQENRIRLEGLAPAQVTELRGASPNLQADAATVGGISASEGLDVRTKAALTLPTGGFLRFEMNPAGVEMSAADSGPGRGTPPPTLANVAYGRDPRQVLDFWRAPSDKPTPLLFYIHGGGWTAGSKSDPCTQPVLGVDFPRYLHAGISIVSIEYRFVQQAILAGVKYPVEWPMHDAARALQFVRSKAAEWNIDPKRIAASGASAGACTSLWLAFHDDLADAKSTDPIARESTRLFCAAVQNAQTTLDPLQMKEWTPNSIYGGHAFGFMRDPHNRKTRDMMFPEFLAARDRILGAIREYSPIDHVTADDPPVYLVYDDIVGPPALGRSQKNPTHTANFGLKLAQKLRLAGVAYELRYPGGSATPHRTMQDYLMDALPTR